MSATQQAPPKSKVGSSKKEAEDDKSKMEVDETPKSQEELNLLTVEDIREQFLLLERSVSMREHRHSLRVLRGLPNMRKRLNNDVIKTLINLYFNGKASTDEASKAELLKFIDGQQAMETDASVSSAPATRGKSKPGKVPRIAECEIYINLLMLIYLIDSKSFESGVELGNKLLNRLVKENRRSLDPLAARCYYYYSRVYELVERLEDVRSVLHARLRTAALVHDTDTQATLLNLLLRNYLHYNLIDQAEKLSSKSTFPEMASNNEWARYLYYTGRIKAIQLDYSDARQTLVTALRKAPQSTALGFRQAVTKLVVVVELLLGEIPERAQFKVADMRQTLLPYFNLTKAVRTGDLHAFNETLTKYRANFEKDCNYTLILRVHHNVIKAGVRRISNSYSKVLLSDVATKLQLDSAEDAEFIIAKSIRDGVIEAEINHSDGFVKTKDLSNIYQTNEPQKAFHSRIAFCMDIYKHSVMAMRFPPKSYHADLESAAERREREQQDIEFAKELADEDDDY